MLHRRTVSGADMSGTKSTPDPSVFAGSGMNGGRAFAGAHRFPNGTKIEGPNSYLSEPNLSSLSITSLEKKEESFAKNDGLWQMIY